MIVYDKHEDDDVGLYDTVLSAEDYSGDFENEINGAKL